MKTAQAPISIAALTNMMEAIHAGGRLSELSRGGERALCDPVESAWGPVARRSLHEWFAQVPPQFVMVDLATCAARERVGSVFWVGRACWPYAAAMARGEAGRVGLLRRSVFVDLPRHDYSVRAWATDLILRSPATVAVIADGRGMDTAQSRRLQLAAEAGAAIVALWRPEQEIKTLSVAHYRWRVRPVATAEKHPRWRIERVRCKETAVIRQGSSVNSYLVEHRDAQGLVAIPADVVDRPHASEISPTVQRTA